MLVKPKYDGKRKPGESDVCRALPACHQKPGLGGGQSADMSALGRPNNGGPAVGRLNGGISCFQVGGLLRKPGPLLESFQDRGGNIELPYFSLDRTLDDPLLTRNESKVGHAQEEAMFHYSNDRVNPGRDRLWVLN